MQCNLPSPSSSSWLLESAAAVLSGYCTHPVHITTDLQQITWPNRAPRRQGPMWTGTSCPSPCWPQRRWWRVISGRRSHLTYVGSIVNHVNSMNNGKYLSPLTRDQRGVFNLFALSAEQARKAMQLFPNDIKSWKTQSIFVWFFFDWQIDLSTRFLLPLQCL